jgi:hypothetical protein
MKNDIVDYISRCMECQRVKDKHRDRMCFLHSLPIPGKKWEVVTIDFITKSPRTIRQHDSTMVVVDKLTKASHFFLVKMTHATTNIAEIYMREISRMHEIPKAIVSDRDTKFTSNFWRESFKGFGTNMNFSTTYHPQSNGKTKRSNQVIENMLRMCVMDKPSKWKDYLNLVDFAYNNGYQVSLKMIPFETLYGRKCNTLVSWDKPTDREVLGPELLKDMEDHMVKIKQNLKVEQDRQKIYADNNWTAREFKVGKHVLLKVKPKKISLNLGSFTKLAPKLCGPFEILNIIEPVAYMLSFPTSMNVHNVFHVSLLEKYAHDPNHVIEWNLIQVEQEGDIQVQLMCILDRKVKMLWNRVVELVKVQWTCCGLEDATWEHEDVMREEYP